MTQNVLGWEKKKPELISSLHQLAKGATKFYTLSYNYEESVHNNNQMIYHDN